MQKKIEAGITFSVYGQSAYFAQAVLAAASVRRFDKTLAFDVDLRLCAPCLPEMFNMLERVEIALSPTELDNSQDRQMYGMPMFNNGVILYKKTRAVVDMVKAMYSTFKQNIAKGGTDQEKRLQAPDQRAMAPHFSPAVNPFSLEYSILGDHWNWRGGNVGRKPAESLVINHHPDIRKNTWDQLSKLTGKLMSIGNDGLAKILKDEIHRIHQQAREGKA